MNNGTVAVIGVTFAAVAAIGTLLYEAYQRWQEQQENRQRGGGGASGRPNWDTPPRSSRTPPSSSRNRGRAVCEICQESLRREDITRTRCCRRVFHDRCRSLFSRCPCQLIRF